MRRVTSVVEIEAQYIEASYRVMSSQKLLERYKAGECETVWQEFKNMGEMREQSVKDEVSSVARKTASKMHVLTDILCPSDTLR